MNRNWRNKGWLLSLILLMFLAACGTNATHEHAAGEEYTCPMHPQVVQNEPGTCPICGMDLVKKASAGQDVEMTKELEALLRPTNAAVVSSIRTVKPQPTTKSVTATANGVITYDTRRVYTIPARYGGRIEKLYVNYNFQPVRKGQKIMDVYSPDLLTAQRELLFIRESDPNNHALLEAAKQKLRLLGVTDAQIGTLLRTGQEQYAFSIFSPYDGYIFENTAHSDPGTAPVSSAPTGGSSMDNMGSGTSMNGSASPVQSGATTAPPVELAIREGMYVETGQTLFEVVNPKEVWAEFDVHAQDAAHIRVGDSVAIWRNPGASEVIPAKVNFVQPFYANGENFRKIRVYLSNTQPALKIGEWVSATFAGQPVEGLWVPQTAVQDLGVRQVVFVKQNGVFVPKAVTVGSRAGNQVAITSGVSADEAIAVDAQFLVDSESFIQTSEN